VQITAICSRSKQEAEFQYGGCLYFKTGSSYISAANWEMLTKFILLIYSDLLKTVTWTNTKPELVGSYWAVATAILKNGNDVIFLQWVLRFGRNSTSWCRMKCKLREVIEIKTGSWIPIWQTFVFPKRK